MANENTSFISRAVNQIRALFERLPGFGEEGPSPKRGRVVIRLRQGLLASGVPRLDALDQIGGWRELRQTFPGLELKPVFGQKALSSLDGLSAAARERDPAFQPTDFRTYFYADMARQRMDRQRELVRRALALPELIETAYIDRPGPERMITRSAQRLASQGYRGPAPDGIDAEHAATVKGGDGEGQFFVDFERGWTLDHQDLKPLNIPCDGSVFNSSRYHGTAVLGVVCGQNVLGTGCRGIAPAANVKVVSFTSKLDRPDRLAIAAGALNPTKGTLLIEAQVYLFVTIDGQSESLLGPPEGNDADLEVIKTATAAGVAVVEIGGNGNERTDNKALAIDLDAYVNPAGLHVLNPVHPDFQDSGAIIVSAARSPTGSGTPRTRMPYASHGQRIDCFAWGENIETCSSDASGATQLYTDVFDGTSGAAAIVAGAAVAVLGAAAQAGAPLSPAQLRARLRDDTINTKKHPSETTLIGTMPDLAKLV